MAADAHADAADTLELTILMPCLDEAETIEVCVRKARAFLHSSGIAGEVLIADNGSSDGSQALATAAGARGRYMIMGDADDSYDFSKLMPFVQRLRDAADLVMGNRFRGGIAAGEIWW